MNAPYPARGADPWRDDLRNYIKGVVQDRASAVASSLLPVGGSHGALIGQSGVATSTTTTVTPTLTLSAIVNLSAAQCVGQTVWVEGYYSRVWHSVPNTHVYAALIQSVGGGAATYIQISGQRVATTTTGDAVLILSRVVLPTAQTWAVGLNFTGGAAGTSAQGGGYLRVVQV